jgi:hypothetical protein
MGRGVVGKLMGLGGYLTWTAAGREIVKHAARAGTDIKLLPVEVHGNFLKLITSDVFKNNSDFTLHGDTNYRDQLVLPLVLNNPKANYCKGDSPEKAIHEFKSHIIEQICECYGIQDPELKCVMHLTHEEKKFAKDFHEKVLNSERFITIEPYSKDNYTPNREYPIDKWQNIIDSLHSEIKIVQVGNSKNVLKNVIDLTGETTFREAISVIRRSELFIASESGLVHGATAVDTKSVVIITGYQHERMVAYPQNINVNIASHGPCGLKIECGQCLDDADAHNWKDLVTIIKKEI